MPVYSAAGVAPPLTDMEPTGDRSLNPCSGCQIETLIQLNQKFYYITKY